MTSAEEYRALRARALSDPEGFWAEAAEEIDWFRRWDRVLNEDRPPFTRWFEGALVNTCWNALDRHVAAGRGTQAAIIYDSPMTGVVRSISYAELLEEVRVCAGAMRDLGVGKGDRVIIYMPMIPEAAVAMLACARLGAVHSVVFGGFAANELAVRIDHARPKLVVSASCGLEPGRLVRYKPMLDEALGLCAHKAAKCLIVQRPQAEAAMTPGRDVDWRDAMAAAQPVDCVPVEATDPLYILYTSGTTGQPKGIVRDNGGHAVALSWSLKHFYGLKPGEVFWGASDIGWVVGHSYIVYGPLIYGATAIMYEGKPVGTPDAGAYWRVIKEHGVAVMFCAPTAFRGIRREDPEGKLLAAYAPVPLRALFLAGERSDLDTLTWTETLLGVPVIDHWWQTETGWPVSGNPLGTVKLPVKYGSVCVPLPGWDVRVLDEDGRELPAGEIGALVCKTPLPPGALTTLWEADDRFVESYFSRFPGFYHTADAGVIDEDGYLQVLARTDDIINVAGHRLSTGLMEEVVSGHEAVAECAVIGVADELKGQVPLAFVVLHHRSANDHAAAGEAVKRLVREKIGPVASLRSVVVVAALPKTRSGKILRSTLQRLAQGDAWTMPATIDDPLVLQAIAATLTDAGYLCQPAQA